ncbi:uncharacterized protein LOC144195583 [Stigmatopora nigra]
MGSHTPIQRAHFQRFVSGGHVVRRAHSTTGTLGHPWTQSQKSLVLRRESAPKLLEPKIWRRGSETPPGSRSTMAGEPSPVSPAKSQTPAETPAETPVKSKTPGESPSPAPTPPDLECRVCYSRFNNVFQCPKMLECKHTFCLECLARINVKSARPAAIRCPLCRHPTPLPAPDLSRLATDARVLASLPAAMRRAHSVRFYRAEGKLHIQRVSRCQAEPGESQLDISLPEAPVQRAAAGAAGNGSGLGHESESGLGLGRASRCVCRALLLTVVLLMSVVLAGIIFLLTFDLNNL